MISGNGAQGVLLEPGVAGNQVLGNQIGVVGPIDGFYFQVGNGARRGARSSRREPRAIRRVSSIHRAT